MLSHTVLLALVAAVGAVPLNINLGAYSPALVVGDGEISLGAAGAAGASELMATLAQGAQQGAAGAAREGQQANAQAGEAAQQGGEAQQQGEAQKAEQPKEQPAEAEAAKRGNLVRDINEILKREAAPAPEPTEAAHIDAVSAAIEWIKRDLNSFNAALSYSERAQQNQPKVELGTGAEGSGVGITVNAGLNVPANSAANGAAAPGKAEKVKRSEVVEDSEAPKMTLVAITEV